MIKLSLSMAFNNIKNNRKTFVPYMLSSIMTIAIFYIVCSLGSNESLDNIWGGNIIQSYMRIGQVIVAIFAVIFLFYINSFLVKRRHSEFGLYNILGMEKRHISMVIAFETLYSFVISTVIGLAIGILLDKLMYLIVLNIIDATIPMGFYISLAGIKKVLTLFGVIFIMIFLKSVRQVYKAKPIELLKSGNIGEKEPRAKWILALVGFIALLGGYGIAVFTDNPVAAFSMFFVAVILVIVGTYLLFTAGSVALLKILKKNKRFYYKPNHFISVSSMIYRMKRNAVGLASICILSTMVLVMISSVVFMYVGIDDSMQKRYPTEFKIGCVAGDPLLKKCTDELKKNIKDEGLQLNEEIQYKDLSFSSVYNSKSDTFETDPDKYQGMSAIKSYNNLTTMCFVTLDEYNKAMNKHEALGENEVIVCSKRTTLHSDRINIFDYSFKVKKTVDEFIKNGDAVANIMGTHFIVVKDDSVLNDLYAKQSTAYSRAGSYIRMNYMADVAGNSEINKAAIMEAYNKTIAKCSTGALSDFTGQIQCRANQAEGFVVDFSGLFFIGIFLGLLFITATVLIVYYKQITEGYEDKKRFEIMQNVGMSHAEVRKSINSQILIVFFMPLVTAGVHVGFAFPFIFKIMMLLGLLNMGLFAVCTLGCFLVFGIFYTVIYMLTARLYYGIVKK